MVQPFPGMEPDGEDHGADAPVSEHADPYGNWSKAPDTAQIYTQNDTTQPHGAAGGNHGELHIACGSHAISWDKGKHPGNRLYNGDEDNHLETKPGAFGFHAAKHGDRPSED